jgi:hypothetical protein
MSETGNGKTTWLKASSRKEPEANPGTSGLIAMNVTQPSTQPLSKQTQPLANQALPCDNPKENAVETHDSEEEGSLDLISKTPSKHII